MALMTQVGLEFIAKDRSSRGLMMLNRNLGSLHRSFRRLGVTMLSVAGVGGFGYMIKKQMETIDSTAKLSDRLNIATEALVGLQHGAKISGVETGTLNKSLEIFSRRLGEVDMGIGQARYSLEKLGLDYRELIGLQMDEAFSVIADRIGGLATQAEKAAAANYLFGRSGQQLLNMFEEGSRGIEKYRLEAEKLGLAFTRIDAAKVEAADDALTKLRAVFEGIFRTFTVELSPYIEAAATAFTDWATAGEGAGEKVISVIESMTFGIANFNANVHDSIAKMYELADAVTNLDEIMVWLSKRGGSGMRKTYAELAAEQRKLAAEERAAAQQAIENIRTQMEIIKNRPSVRTPGEDNIISPTGFIGPPEPSAEQRKQIEDDARRRLEITERIYQDMGNLNEGYYQTEIQLLDRRREEYEQFIDDKILLEQWYASEVRKIQEEIRQANMTAFDRYIEDLENRLNDMSSKWAMVAADIESSMANAFYSIIAEGASWRDAMSGFFKEVGNAFSRMAAQMIAEAIMVNIMKALMGGGIGGNLAVLSTSGGPSGMGYARGGIIENGMITSFQRGGIVNQPTVFPLADGIGLMGEAGPEAIMPLERGPGGRLGVIAHGGGPQVVNYNINIKAMDSQDVQRALRKEKAFLEDLHFNSLKSNHPARRFEK